MRIRPTEQLTGGAIAFRRVCASKAMQQRNRLSLAMSLADRHWQLVGGVCPTARKPYDPGVHCVAPLGGGSPTANAALLQGAGTVQDVDPAAGMIWSPKRPNEGNIN